MNTYQFIADQAAHHAVRLLCRVVGGSRSGSLAWRSRLPSARAGADQELTKEIRQIHAHSRETSGSIRVRATLGDRGCAVGRRRVARLMRRAGLRGVHGQRRRMRTTVVDRTATPARDRVERALTPAQIGAPNRLWLADIPSVATTEGWLYLAAMLDGFSRRVVGWAMADHRRAELVIDALTMAIQRRQPAPGLVHQSDRGAHYTALAFGQRLQEAGTLPSTGSGGDCYDNAVVEAFFSSLNVERLDRQPWPTRAAARLAIFEYIEVWDHRQRLHSTLGSATPIAFETRAQADAAASPRLVRKTESTPETLRRALRQEWEAL